MPTMTTINCKGPSCTNTKEVRTSDLARGWGLFCSKTCKAKEQQERANEHRTPQRRGGLRMFTTETAEQRRQRLEDEAFDAGLVADEAGWDGHENV